MNVTQFMKAEQKAAELFIRKSKSHKYHVVGDSMYKPPYAV